MVNSFGNIQSVQALNVLNPADQKVAAILHISWKILLEGGKGGGEEGGFLKF